MHEEENQRQRGKEIKDRSTLHYLEKSYVLGYKTSLQVGFGFTMWYTLSHKKLLSRILHED